MGHLHLLDHPLEPISRLVPYAAIILTITLSILYLIKNYVLEGFLLPSLYGDAYKKLNESARRGFVNHHITGSLRIIILVLGIYPFLSVGFGNSFLHTRFLGTRTTLGDILLVCSQLLVSMYIIELLIRVKVSPVGTLHHLGTIIVAQSAVALSVVRHGHVHSDAVFEFILCCVWGAFDVIAEFLPNVAIILYRVKKNEHAFLRKFFYITAATTFAGTVAQTILVFYLFGSLWSKWDLAFKVATPVLHIAFSAAQVHGSRIFYGMAKREGKRLLQKRDDPEGGSETSPK